MTVSTMGTARTRTTPPARTTHAVPEYFEAVTVHRAGRRMGVSVLAGVLAMFGWTGGMIYTISGWISGS
ncbi:morphogenic membrane protein MmpA [Streptomyces sp. CA-294286]|uniref:morphogenic membrane protein MmpA n=1 Tax=Streptomyces sp. CA-294286 TaxID=3240070 RepID=UPI003D8D07F2